MVDANRSWQMSIELNAGTIGGPVLWLLAVAITPFGLPKLRR